MTYELLGIIVLWTFLFGYLIVASVDFGAGFFSFDAKYRKNDFVLNKVIQRYLSPVWEVTNVFLIFFLIGIIGFFPDSAYYYGTALLIPGSIAVILLAIRGSYYAFNTYGAEESKLFSFLYGATGLLIPASLTVVLTVSLGGYIQVSDGNVSLLYGELFTSIYSWSVVLLAIASVLFISAMFLVYYAGKAQDHEALATVRKYALSWAGPTILMGIIVFMLLSQRNATQFNNMLDLWWAFAVSAVAFAGAVYLVWQKRSYGTAFLLVTIQYFTAFFAYGSAHLPYLLYPHLTIYDGFTNESMALALIIAFVAGLFLLIPSLYLLMRMFLFDPEYVQGKK
ncbi:cytochrome d ubiquinol oxidase subunit II [Salisediminibacterium beveridgei]|uniref:Cytochrome d ubiquinol oxidase subunit II n=1 Tax=Salisediminibacterium beveridgei TaxID=632773 RepID=A0A1D7QTY8_9BACI|nr:cytochrome d ubiquinol oxidase subunit II [Salisediminibacterium beveridgei]AOM82438.1 Cytochrome d ubiquinol oxidase subunit II [Salisediminibacterium beveridgei]